MKKPLQTILLMRMKASSKIDTGVSETSTPQTHAIPERFFLSPDQQRLRAGWRLIIQTLRLIVIGIIFIGVGNFLLLAYGFICTKQLWLPIGLHIV